jgi:anti-sigma B factor antagonist
VSALEARKARWQSSAKKVRRRAPAPLVMPCLRADAKIGHATVRVEVRGELDLATADRLHEFVMEVMTQSSPLVVLDLSGLAFCDPYGLSALLRIAGAAEGAGGGVTLMGVPPFFARLVRITQLEKRLPVPAGGARMA